MSAGAQARAAASISGAREGRPSALRKLLARAAARDLAALVVPGPEVARAAGLDLEAAGLSLAAGPRQASVLVVLGHPAGLPEALERAAEVAYAQMLRPRAVLTVGTEGLASLPFDARCEPDQESLAVAIDNVRRAFREGAFTEETEDFEAPALETRTIYTCSMHPEIEQEESGQCPRCGMDLIPKESAGGEAGTHHDHGTHVDHGTHEPGGHEQHSNEADEHADHDTDASDGGHADGEHDHGGHEEMGFMSMVEMTQGTPRSSDGLQMEWVDAPFGPLLPGLPGGLSLSLTLDGDTVAEAEASAQTGGAEKLLHGPASGLTERLSGLDPLSPITYRLLATLALEDAAGASVTEDERLRRIAALELERAASHAGWISGFAYLLGLDLLRHDAARLELRLRRLLAESLEPESIDHGKLPSLAAGLSRRLNTSRLLRARLRGVGALKADEAAGVGGPVSRAAGRREDLRSGDAIYAALGFEPIVENGSDALARLRLRAAEMGQSLSLARDALHKSGSPGREIGAARTLFYGSGSASVETPRGAATLSLTVDSGEIAEARLEVPSKAALALARTVAERRELGDALVGVASLDISPWGLG